MNILLLCLYPIQTPRHGGQLRAHHLVENYKKLGHHVEVAGVLSNESYAKEVGFCETPPRSLINSIISNPMFMEDYAIGKIYATIDEYFHLLCANIKSTPDFIHVEQPWLFEFAKRYQAEYAPLATLAYGSQNIEHGLKKELVDEISTHENAVTCERLTLATELNAILDANIVFAVTKSDADWINEYTSVPIYLAPNGVAKWSRNSSISDKIKALTDNRNYALYCASAFLPNVSGFLEMILNSDTYTPEKELNIIIAGGVGYPIRDYLINRFQSVPKQFIITGELSQLDLQDLINGAHTILLPITKGGGSNLKSAEAIWSGKHVITTSHAFRGFESFLTSKGIHVVNNPQNFLDQIQKTLKSPPLNLSEAELIERDSVSWDITLSSLANVGTGKQLYSNGLNASSGHARESLMKIIKEFNQHIHFQYKKESAHSSQLALLESSLAKAEAVAKDFETRAINAERKAQYFELKANDADLKAQYFELKANDADLKAHKAEEKKQNYKIYLDLVKVKNTDLANQNLVLTNNFKALQSEILSAQENANNLYQRVKDLESSYSWRITKPIRQSKTLIKERTISIVRKIYMHIPFTRPLISQLKYVILSRRNNRTPLTIKTQEIYNDLKKAKKNAKRKT